MSKKLTRFVIVGFSLVATSSPALADDYYFGSKFWDPKVHAFRGTMQMPTNYSAWGWDNEKWALMPWISSSRFLQLGYHMNIWGINYFYRWNLTNGGDSQTILIWPPTEGAHTFFAWWDDLAKNYVMMIDCGSCWSISTPTQSPTGGGFRWTDAGIYAYPGSGTVASGQNSWTSLKWTTIASWSTWQSNLPSPTETFSYNTGTIHGSTIQTVPATISQILVFDD